MNPYDDDAPTNVQGPPPPPPPPGQPNNSDQKSAIIAAGVGTATLAGAAYAMSQFLDDDTAITEETGGGKAEEETSLPPTPPKTPVDTTPSVPPPPEPPLLPEHPKTFDEAFDEARTAHSATHNGEGGGGYFEFDRDGDGKKEYYSTYLDSEWQGLSHNEKQDFYATVPGYEPPSGNGGGVHSGIHPDTGIAHNNVPPPVENVDDTKNDNEFFVEVEDTPSSETAGKADFALSEMGGHEVIVIDIDHDNRPDGIYNPDNHIIVMDTDGDHILDTRAVVDVEHHQITQAEHLGSPMSIDGNMELLHESDSHVALADGNADPTLAPGSEHHTPVAHHTDSQPAGSDLYSKADYAVGEIAGQEVVLIDINHDDRPDGFISPDNNVIVMDTDGDYVLDTRATIDVEHHKVTHVEHIDERITIDGTMHGQDHSEHEDNTHLADNSDFGSDFDNNADTSDFDYAA